MYGFKFLFWGQVTVQGLFLCVLGTNMALNLANIRYTRASTIKLFYKLTAISERLSEKVHATILKGIVCGLEFTVLQRSLKEITKGHGRTFASAKESNKSRFDSYRVRNSVLITSHIPFGIVARTFFPTTFLGIAVYDAASSS